MQPWIETTGVVVLALAGAFLGQLFSRLKKPLWAVGYLVPMVLVSMVALARRIDRLSFLVPFSWVMAGRREFVILAFSTAMLFWTPLSRLRLERQRGMVRVLAIVCVFYFSVLPFLGEALYRPYLSNLKTHFDAEGVCLQSYHFTCGPAAAVTALRAFGLEAEEGELAILSHTSPTAGTPADLLCAALQKRYAPQGLLCEYKHFKSIEELKDAGVTIAVTKYGLLVDHYVAVLGVTDEEVVVGDPLAGRKALSHQDFGSMWRFAGIALKRLRARKTYFL